MNLLNSSLTRLYLCSRLLCSPLEAIYTLLIFIAAKELNISLFQLAILASSKPVSSLLAFYLSASVAGKPRTFKNYLIVINTLGALPALLFPYVNNSWFYVAAHVTFMISLRATYPVWNAILNSRLPLEIFTSLQARAITVQHTLTIICPLIFGYLLDLDPNIWRSLFIAMSGLQLLNTLVLTRLPMPYFTEPLKDASSTWESPITLWRKSCQLLAAERGFMQYLLLFFCGGAGLVMMQSALPIFFKENLHLSYTAITIATSGCKGLALIATAKIWASWVNRISIYRLNFYINIASALFIGGVLLSNFNVYWIYAAYLLYGCMQAGCELSWNMSGPLFARQRESTLFASLNLPLIGIRGVIFPFIAQILMTVGSSNDVFLVAGIITAACILYAYVLDPLKRYTEAISCGGRSPQQKAPVCI